MTKTTDSAHSQKKKTLWIQALGGILLLGGAAACMVLIFSTEPEAVRETATRKTAMLVKVESAEQGKFRPVIEVMGTVIPAREVMLRPRVEGEVIRMAPDFVPGRVIEKGEEILKVDPADYEIRLRLMESGRMRAEADLTLEKGRREIARQDLEQMEGELSSINRDLVLREPQFRTVMAAVEAARASVEQAELDLKRTSLTAPFRAKVLERNVNLGSQVSPQMQVAHLVDIDRFWIEATVPLSVVHRLEFPETADAEGMEVVIRNETAWGPGAERKGRLDQLIGSLESRTRMARILVEVEDPMHLEQETANRRLLLGSFVRVEVPVRELKDVVRINRDYIHSGDTVWVMSEEAALEIRKVRIEFSDKTYAYIREGLAAGDQVVTTSLATVVEGAALRTEAESAEESGMDGEDS